MGKEGLSLLSAYIILELSKYSLTDATAVDNLEPADLIPALKQFVATEWTVSAHEYTSFLTESQLKKEAERLQRDGIFDEGLGDLVLTGISNALRVPIILFTSKLRLPITVFMPTYTNIASIHCVYMGFLHLGTGRYEVVTPQGTETESTCGTGSDTEAATSSTSLKGCSCGRKAKSKNPACYSDEYSSYTSKCPCFTRQIQCNKLCICRGCRNSYGKEEAPEVMKKRKRASHPLQKHPLKGVGGMHFMEGLAESINLGSVTDFEFILLAEIVHELFQEDQKRFSLSDEDVLFNFYPVTLVSQSMSDLKRKLSRQPGVLKEEEN